MFDSGIFLEIYTYQKHMHERPLRGTNTPEFSRCFFPYRKVGKWLVQDVVLPRQVELAKAQQIIAYPHYL